MIDPPSRPASHPDADTDCEAAIEGEFQALAERAQAAGWSGERVARALLSLAMAHIKGRQEQADVERAIGIVRRSEQ